MFLEVSESSLSSISRNNFDYHDCIREMLEVWLKQTDHASWHDLAEAVELLDPPKAQMIRQRYMGEERHAEGTFSRKKISFLRVRVRVCVCYCKGSLWYRTK